jgi:hypothetical protein
MITITGCGGSIVGGFISSNSLGSCANCYTRMTITITTSFDYVTACSFIALGGSVDKCYATGSITWTNGKQAHDYNGVYAGGTVSSCFWDTQTSGIAISNGGIGKTTAQMKTLSTFTDAAWDFATPVWYLIASYNAGYPSLDYYIGIQTLPATNITPTTATLNGRLVFNAGTSTQVRFNYGLTDSYGTNTDWQDMDTDLGNFHADITGLDPGVEYHFRAQARQ